MIIREIHSGFFERVEFEFGIEFGGEFAMRGRKPKPTALQIAEGDPRKHGVHKLEERLKAEPPGTRGLPRCPAHLKGEARKAWRMWCEELERMNLDCRPDAPMLAGACLAYATVIECEEAIQKQGRFIPRRALDPATKKLVVVGLKSHPAVAQMHAALMIQRAFCSEFGLTPVSRTRFANDKPADNDDELLEILSRPREAKKSD